MALLKLSDTWVIKDYQQISQSSIVGQKTESDPLSALSHHEWPGLAWRIQLYPRGDSRAKPNYASVFVKAEFGSAEDSVTSVWAERTLMVVTDGTKANLRKTFSCCEYLMGAGCCWGFVDAFQQDALAAALTNGNLAIKLDLVIYKIVDVLKCRESVRALFSASQHADVSFQVGGKRFKAHTAIFANRCPGLRDSASVPFGTTAEAFEAFLGAMYDKFEFLSNWKLALGVYELADKCGPAYLKEFCDDAVSDIIPSLGYPALLQVLPLAIRCNALVTKAACVRSLMEATDLLTSAEWSAFKDSYSVSTDVCFAIIEMLLRAKSAAGESASTIFHAAEVKLSHTWPIATAHLLQAVPPHPTVVSSPMILEHKAFPLVKWQLELHPRGNTQDPEHKQGYASLYLKAIFGPKDNDPKAVYATWTATITTSDAQEVCVLASPDFILYTGAKEMKFGFANAFLCEQHIALLQANNAGLDIRLELTIASIPEMLKCRTLISSLRSVNVYADVEIDVNGTIIKAHKFVLATRSTKFAQIFEAEKNGKLEVKDATPEAFKSLIAAIYYDSWDFLANMGATIDVLKLAEEYGVADLKRYCDEALAHFTKKSNALTILPDALSCKSVAAKAACIKLLFGGEGLAYEWFAFKTHDPKRAMSLCEAIIQSLAQTGAHADAGLELPAQAHPPATNRSLQIPVRWPIANFRDLMKISQLGSGILCPQKFSHDSMPGIEWELILYPDGKVEHNQHVALFMRPLLTSNKKSSATAPSGGYSLRIEPVAANNNLGLPIQVLDVQPFANQQSERGLLKFAHQPLIDALIDSQPDLPVVLSGSILVEPVNRPTVLLRKALESGDNSDFSIKVDNESFAVHKHILSQASTVLKGMLNTTFKEVTDAEIVLKETTVEAVRAMLQFWYGDPLCFDGLDELSTEVYKLADEYDDVELRQMCEDALLRMVTPDNLVDLAAFAAHQGCEPLEKMTAKFIVGNSDVLKSKAWCDLKKKNPALAFTIMERIISKYSIANRGSD